MCPMMTNGSGANERPGLVGRALAAVYDRFTVGMEREVYAAHRRRLLGAAHGRVLDVGAGTGANLPQYPWDRISGLVLLDPSPGMLARARRKATAGGFSVQVQERRAEQLPFRDACFDTVVFTLALCTIPNPDAALREARRVLQPDGRPLVLEHVRSVSFKQPNDVGPARGGDRCEGEVRVDLSRRHRGIPPRSMGSHAA